MSCPYLDYRREGEDRQFDEPRAYCRVAEQFVQPMRADVCNGRYDLDHASHCEIYLEHATEGGTDDQSDTGHGPRGDDE